MPEFETISKEEMNYGKRNFIEIARKKITTEQGESEIISISKGFIAPDGSKRFRKGGSIGFPNEQAIREFLVNALQKV
jgi:hypothetical protein